MCFVFVVWVIVWYCWAYVMLLLELVLLVWFLLWYVFCWWCWVWWWCCGCGSLCCVLLFLGWLWFWLLFCFWLFSVVFGVLFFLNVWWYWVRFFWLLVCWGWCVCVGLVRLFWACLWLVYFWWWVWCGVLGWRYWRCWCDFVWCVINCGLIYGGVCWFRMVCLWWWCWIIVLVWCSVVWIVRLGWWLNSCVIGNVCIRALDRCFSRWCWSVWLELLYVGCRCNSWSWVELLFFVGSGWLYWYCVG